MRVLQAIEGALFRLYLKSTNDKWYDRPLYWIWAKSFDLTTATPKDGYPFKAD